MDMRTLRPAAIKTGAQAPATPEAREARLTVLLDRWAQFAGEYDAARHANDQEKMTNLRGLMVLIKKEIARLGGSAPEFPMHGENHLADL